MALAPFVRGGLEVMAEPILNADEIRDLLRQSAGSARAVDRLWEGETVTYDILKSASQGQDKVKIADQVHQTAAPLIQQALTEISGSEVRFEFTKDDMIPSTEAIAEISLENSIVIPWSDTEKSLEGLFRIDRVAFFAIYGKMLGGSGAFEKKGALTRLEQVFLSRLMEPVVSLIERGWKSHGNWNFELGRLITDPQKLAQLGWNFDALKASFRMASDGKEGDVVAIFPKDILSGAGKDPVAAEGHAEVSQEGNDRQWSDAVREAILGLPIPVTVYTGNMHVSLKQALGLQVGEEFPLHLDDGNALVLVRGRPMFSASVGAFNQNRAVQIISRLDKHNEESTHE